MAYDRFGNLIEDDILDDDFEGEEWELEFDEDFEPDAFDYGLEYEDEYYETHGFGPPDSDLLNEF